MTPVAAGASSLIWDALPAAVYHCTSRWFPSPPKAGVAKMTRKSGRQGPNILDSENWEETSAMWLLLTVVLLVESETTFATARGAGNVVHVNVNTNVPVATTGPGLHSVAIDTYSLMKGIEWTAPNFVAAAKVLQPGLLRIGGSVSN